MSSTFPPAKGRVLVVVSAVLSAFAGAAWSLLTALRDMTDLLRGPGRASVDELVVAVSAAGALVLLLWVALGLLASVVAALPGPLGDLSRWARDSIAPETVRRCAALLLGVAVVSACAPGGAAAAEVATVRAMDADPVSAPAPLWLEPAPLWLEPASNAEDPAPPMAPTPAHAPTPAPAPEWTPAPVRALPPVTLTAPRPPVADQQCEVTVRRGDTLWDLAAAYLSPDATDAQIASATLRWYAANRRVIGADPDLILPGQVLAIPTDLAAATTGGSR